MAASGTLLVLGANGQVGRALTTLLGPRAIALGRAQADLSRPSELIEQIEAALRERAVPVNTLGAVINAAAYTQVDRAESEEATALAVNAESPGLVARWCEDRGIPFVHYSTDYVFLGEGNVPWRESDATGPLSAYGRTKLEGERRVAEAGGKHLIFRTSWVYDRDGKNFLNTMLRLRAERDVLRVVADQFGAPTYAPHLAQATLAALENARGASRFPSGVYHLCGAGETTWHGFACAIFEAAERAGRHFSGPCRVEAIQTEEFPTPARRPRNSRMDCGKAARELGVRMPEWREGLRDFF